MADLNRLKKIWAIFPPPSLLKGLTGFLIWPLPRGCCGLMTNGPYLPYLLILVVLNREHFCPQGTLRQCLETFGYVTAVGEEVLQASSGQGPDVRLNALQCTGQALTDIELASPLCQ